MSSRERAGDPASAGKVAKPQAEAGKPRESSPPPRKAATKGRKGLSKLRKELVSELAQLRESLASSARVFTGNLDGELARILCVLERETIPGEPERLPSARIQAAMIAALEDLRVKPKKGRLKDLERIERLAGFLSRLMDHA